MEPLLQTPSVSRGIKASSWVKKTVQTQGPSRIHASPHLSTRRYARIVDSWDLQLGLDPANYRTHTLRRTKATLIYRRTKNLRAIQLLLGHTKFGEHSAISRH
jgi:integrase